MPAFTNPAALSPILASWDGFVKHCKKYNSVKNYNARNNYEVKRILEELKSYNISNQMEDEFPGASDLVIESHRSLQPRQFDEMLDTIRLLLESDYRKTYYSIFKD